ncbi:unnamed protein product, partial [Vitis vinifera]|uniref:Uncharacterized protein n=1 Tax=Vitis vinifera TaxID=29760 RepID=D7U2L8_VITVI
MYTKGRIKAREKNHTALAKRHHISSLLQFSPTSGLMALMPGLQINLISLRAQAQGQLLQPCLQPHIHFLMIQMDPEQIVPAKQKISKNSTMSMAWKYLLRKKTLRC